MTNKEAKQMLQARLECMKQEDLSAIGKGCDKKCDECHLNYEQGNRGEQKEAISVGIAALELQTAKKPIKVKNDGIRYTDTYRCPTCKGAFTGTGIADYCYHCGQRIEWDDKSNTLK